MQTEKYKKLEQKKWFCGLKFVIDMVAAYLTASWAIDSGNLLVYFVTVVLFASAVRYAILLAKNYVKK